VGNRGNELSSRTLRAREARPGSLLGANSCVASVQMLAWSPTRTSYQR
jgi:hypothetical protein